MMHFSRRRKNLNWLLIVYYWLLTVNQNSKITSHLCQQVRNSSNRTCIAKIGREKYCRMYFTTIVNADGSSYTVRYHEPKRIINLPINTSELTEEELKQHSNRRVWKEKVVIVETPDDDAFDVNRYSHLWKSKPKDK